MIVSPIAQGNWPVRTATNERHVTCDDASGPATPEGGGKDACVHDRFRDQRAYKRSAVQAGGGTAFADDSAVKRGGGRYDHWRSVWHPGCSCLRTAWAKSWPSLMTSQLNAWRQTSKRDGCASRSGIDQDRDRPKLRGFAGDAYGVQKSEYQSVISPECLLCSAGMELSEKPPR
jgi:hypothetical protein